MKLAYAALTVLSVLGAMATITDYRSPAFWVCIGIAGISLFALFLISAMENKNNG